MAGRSALILVVSVCLSVVPGAALAHDRDGRFLPGADGVGDPYFPLDGNGGYDVNHYDLEVAYEPDTDVLTGTATIRARATQDLSRFNLDLDGLTVGSVTVDDHPARWNRNDGELSITPRRGIRDAKRFTVVVRYAGVPQTIEDAFGTSGFFHTDDGALVVGEPAVAATWFPSNDHPIDKASLALEITVPAGLEAISNGRLEDTRTRHGRTTWAWEAKEPMAPYLAMLAIGQFDVRSYRQDGVRFWDAVDPELYEPVAGRTTTPGEVADGAFARQAEIISFLDDSFGPYPFATGGGIVDNEDRLFFALENQTRPIYSVYDFADPLDADAVIVHEIAHQWYGDSLTLARWRDIWLNEGFATYAEWMWSEREGLATVQQSFDALYAVPASDPFWALRVSDPGPEHIFDAPVYNRGAMTLHALRATVGDDDFFSILRRWADSREGDNVTTAEFIALAERVSGRQLDTLFATWLDTPVKPPT